MSDIRSCPGLYCGRTEFEDGSWSDCGACPRGFRTNATSYCQQCFDAPSLYDWQYLGFMILLPMVLNWFFIDLGAIGKGKDSLILQHLCAFIEVVTGTLTAVLVLAPTGRFDLYVCSPKDLSDWYTLLHNPQPDYKETLHCTQEAVYPLRIEQSAPALLISSVTDMRNLIIILGHWIVHAYGIISLTGFKELWYLSLVPAPAMFYILTAQFTDPVKIHSD
ncbi:JNK1/MAPK8-associated membrane protein [Operophtera brumata]|uniref:JNK1/MAPK8-associated membrane protein n=1 Tax=Operophtera brumata TaxID=104452 RepID=A0A0L7K3F7_OPEBR|nr:JNK1/MAPK8-associated membrane protein [Operophtera brumata]